jgi:hypothetical protein
MGQKEWFSSILEIVLKRSLSMELNFVKLRYLGF